MFCNKCGNQISDSAKFCTQCGNVIDYAITKNVNNQTNITEFNQISYDASKNATKKIEKKSKLSVGIGIAAVVVIIMIVIAVVILIPLLKDDKKDKEIVDNSNPFSNGLSVGDVVYFGEYEQDDNTSNGAEPILWDVIGQNEEGFLLVSHYVLDYMPFNDGDVAIVDYATGDFSSGITWKNSSIRNWLNNEFMQTAFSSNEQSYIIPVSNTTTDFKETLGQEEHYFNMQGGTGCGTTTDNVFLLSIEDYCTYMNPAYVEYFSYIYVSIDAMAAPTKYARSKGAVIINFSDGDGWLSENGCTGTLDSDYNGVYTPWLLRNPGSAQDNVTVMSVDDLGYSAASQPVSGPCGIRPAIWVSAPANGNYIPDENNEGMDAYSQCIGYWAPNTVDTMSSETFWIQPPQVMEITESSVIIHGPNYSANREDLQYKEKDGIEYFISKENGFRFYYSTSEGLLVLELQTEDGRWIRWADFK